MNKVKNILYLGWLGKGNVGDDVLFEYFKTFFYENFDRNLYNFECNIDAFLPIPNYVYSIDRYDLVILGGGSLLSIPYWLEICEDAYKNNIPIVSWGTGIDGLYIDDEESLYSSINSGLKDKIKSIVTKMSYISVRGPLTKKLLVNCNVPENIINEIGDPATFYKVNKVNKERQDSSNREVKNILVNWGKSGNNILGNNEEWLEEQLEITLQILLNNGYNVTIYPIWTEDIQHVISLGKKFTDNNIQVINEVYDSYKLINFIADFDVTINMKLHSNILSVAANKPFISLAYRGKCFDFGLSVNCKEYVISPSEITAGKILERFNKIVNEYDSIINNYYIAKKKYEPKLKESFIKIYETLEKI